MRRLLFATAAFAVGLSGCFPSASPSSASPARRSPSVAPDAAASPAVGRFAVKTELPKRTFTFKGTTSQYAVYAGHLDGKRPKGVLFYLHGDGYPEFAREDSAYVLESFRQVARARPSVGRAGHSRQIDENMVARRRLDRLASGVHPRRLQTARRRQGQCLARRILGRRRGDNQLPHGGKQRPVRRGRRADGRRRQLRSGERFLAPAWRGVEKQIRNGVACRLPGLSRQRGIGWLVRRRRRICRGAAHISRHRNETRKPRVRSRQRSQRLHPLGAGHAPKNARGRKDPRRSVPG